MPESWIKKEMQKKPENVSRATECAVENDSCFVLHDDVRGWALGKN